MELIAGIMAFVTGAKFTAILAGAAQVVGGFAVLATFTPTPKDDGFFAYIAKGIHFLAMNIGKAKNAG